MYLQLSQWWSTDSLPHTHQENSLHAYSASNTRRILFRRKGLLIWQGGCYRSPDSLPPDSMKKQPDLDCRGTLRLLIEAARWQSSLCSLCGGRESQYMMHDASWMAGGSGAPAGRGEGTWPRGATGLSVGTHLESHAGSTRQQKERERERWEERKGERDN